MRTTSTFVILMYVQVAWSVFIMDEEREDWDYCKIFGDTNVMIICNSLEQWCNLILGSVPGLTSQRWDMDVSIINGMVDLHHGWRKKVWWWFKILSETNIIILSNSSEQNCDLIFCHRIESCWKWNKMDDFRMIRYALKEKKRYYLGIFPNMGGGSSQIPKLL